MAKAIQFSDEEKRYLEEILDDAYKSFQRRKGMATMDEMKPIFDNAMKKTQALREKISKEA